MRIFLAYPPSANERLTIRKDGKGMINTAKYRSWKEQASWTIAMAVRDKTNKVRGPYTLDAIARPPELNRKRDLDNLLKAISDALKDGGAIDDDSLCQKISIEWGALDSPGILIGIQPCRNPLSREGGKSKSPPEIAKSRIPRRSPRAATIPAVTTGDDSDMGRQDGKDSGRPLSSIPAGSIGLKKPKT
jgi:crossover junction endodeoxyribonuclease RusA